MMSFLLGDVNIEKSDRYNEDYLWYSAVKFISDKSIDIQSILLYHFKLDLKAAEATRIILEAEEKETMSVPKLVWVF